MEEAEEVEKQEKKEWRKQQKNAPKKAKALTGRSPPSSPAKKPLPVLLTEAKSPPPNHPILPPPPPSSAAASKKKHRPTVKEELEARAVSTPGYFFNFCFLTGNEMYIIVGISYSCEILFISRVSSPNYHPISRPLVKMSERA